MLTTNCHHQFFSPTTFSGITTTIRIIICQSTKPKVFYPTFETCTPTHTITSKNSCRRMKTSHHYISHSWRRWLHYCSSRPFFFLLLCRLYFGSCLSTALFVFLVACHLVFCSSFVFLCNICIYHCLWTSLVSFHFFFVCVPQAFAIFGQKQMHILFRMKLCHHNRFKLEFQLPKLMLAQYCWVFLEVLTLLIKASVVRVSTEVIAHFSLVWFEVVTSFTDCSGVLH